MGRLAEKRLNKAFKGWILQTDIILRPANIMREEEIMEQNSIETGQSTAPEQTSVPADTQTSAAASGSAPPPVQNNGTPAPVQSAQPQAKKKSKKPLIIAIILAALIGLGIGGFFLYQHFSDDSSGSSKKKDRSKSGSSASESDRLDITDYDAVVDEPEEEEIVYDGPEESEATQLGISHNEDGDFRFMSGSFDETVSSSDEAFQFIADYSDKIGISDPYSELSFIEEKTYKGAVYYKFQQVYQDVPVYGNELIVAVDPDGKVDSVNGGYTEITISTTPSKDRKAAEETARKYAGKNMEISKFELTVLPHTEDGEQKLAYDISVTGDSNSADLLIDADTCEIISEGKMYNAATEILKVDANGTQYRVELEKEMTGNYNICDPTRNITVSDAGMTSIGLVAVSDGFLNGFTPLAATQTSENADGSVNLAVYPKEDLLEQVLPDAKDITTIADLFDPILTEYAVGSMSSVQKAYDYYDTMYGWKSFDGEGMPIELIIDVKDSLSHEVPADSDSALKKVFAAIKVLLPSLKDVQNAAFIKDTNVIVFGKVNSKPLVGPGIIGHEFTHGVIDKIVHMKSNVKAGTINEGYADVMGSVIAGDWEFMTKEVPTDWEYYESALRSAVDPNKFGSPAIKDTSDEFYREYPKDEHDNASIVSHTAYLMTQKGLSNDKVAEVFFGSMFRLISNPDMESVAHAVIKTSNMLSYRKEEQQAIAEAFMDTKMLDTEGKIKIKVHCGNRDIADAVISIDGTEVGRTDDDGMLVLDLESRWIGDITVDAKADGFNGSTLLGYSLGDIVDFDFNLAVNKDFGKTHGSDPDKTGEVTGEKVVVTILAMEADGTSDYAKEKAQEYYVQKGSKISLQKLVDAMGMDGVTTDGTKIYFDTGIVPVELSYHIYGSDEVFDFNKPIYEDVVIEPVVGVGGMDFGGQDLDDLAQELDGIFNGGGMN